MAYDPIFGVRHFRREVLNAESSGRFLLDAGSLPAGWREKAGDGFELENFIDPAVAQPLVDVQGKLRRQRDEPPEDGASFKVEVR